MWSFCGNLILLLSWGEECSINTVKYEYVTHLFFKFFGFILSLLFHTFSPLFHLFIFSSTPLGTTTTNRFLLFSWHRELALSYTSPKIHPLISSIFFQLEDEKAGGKSMEASFTRVTLKMLALQLFLLMTFL